MAELTPVHERLAEESRLHQPEHDLPDLEPAALARMLKNAGGVPAHGNQRSAWEAGCRFDFANPDYR